MSTDLYGVRVLSVDPQELRVRFKVFVVYYDTEPRTHPSVPDDPGFFFYLLWEGASGYLEDTEKGPLAKLVDVDTALDFAWVDANARRFVSGFERVATHNHPLTAEQWDRLCDFYPEHDGAWEDEDLLVQFTYDVRVTDRRWLEPLREGHAWGTAAFALNADTWTARDAPHIPDLSRPAVMLHPFTTTTGDLAYDNLSQLQFSDDGKYLAMCSNKGRVWAYDTSDWAEAAHTCAGDWNVPRMMWVPGEHVLTVRNYSPPQPGGPETEPQWAFDVDTRTEVEASLQKGHRRSRDGAYRIAPNDAGEGGYDLLPTERSPHRRVSHAGRWDPIQCFDFAGDGSRLFLGAQQNLYVVDPATGEVVDKVMDASQRLFRLASNPAGTYLAVASFTRKSYLGLHERRPHEVCIWRTADKKVIMGRQMATYVEALTWSPDGRWLAAALEPTAEGSFCQGQTQLAVFPMGQADERP